MRGAVAGCIALAVAAGCASGAPAALEDAGGHYVPPPTGGMGGVGGKPPMTGGTGGMPPPPPPMDDDAGGGMDAGVDGGDAATDAGAPAITDVPFWIEALEAGTRAVIWVKVSVSAGAKLDLVMRYGDTSLMSASSITDVMVFGDDFSGAAIDTTRWVIDDATGWTVSGGQLHGTNTTGRIHTMATFTSNTSPVVAESRFKATTMPANGFMANGFFTSTSVCFGLLASGPSAYFLRNNATWSASQTWADSFVTNWARSTAQMKSGAQAVLTVARDSDGMNLVPHTYAYTVSGAPVALGKRYDDGNGGQVYDAVWDFVFVRKWVMTEPTVTLGADEALNGACATCYDRTITIDNTAGAALTDHQVRIALDATATTFWSHVGDGASLRLGTL